MKLEARSTVHRIQQLLEILKVNQYRFLLVAILLVLGVPPFLKDLGIGPLVFVILLTLLLLACMNFLRSHRRFIFYTMTIFSLTFLSGWMSYIIDIRNFTIARNLLALSFFSLVLSSLLREIRYSPVVNSAVIFGSIAAYLLMGIIGGNVFALLDIFYPGSFNIALNTQTANFFSFTTLTTVGFGSIYPIRSQAQAFASLFAIAGQLYMTILVAIIVGKYLVYSERKNETDSGKS
jgi:voltage-gated potassium channel